MSGEASRILADIQEAAEALISDCSGISIEMYIANRQLRWSVERGLEIIGEASRRLTIKFPDTAVMIPQIEAVVGLRNRIAHGYDRIDHELVFLVVQESLPELIELVSGLRSDAGDAPDQR